jgi:hypothetical protein
MLAALAESAGVIGGLATLSRWGAGGSAAASAAIARYCSSMPSKGPLTLEGGDRVECT